MKPGRVGDEVVYVPGPDDSRKRAKIVDAPNSTEATIELLEGPQKGQTIPSVPWGILKEK